MHFASMRVRSILFRLTDPSSVLVVPDVPSAEQVGGWRFRRGIVVSGRRTRSGSVHSGTRSGASRRRCGEQTPRGPAQTARSDLFGALEAEYLVERRTDFRRGFLDQIG